MNMYHSYYNVYKDYGTHTHKNQDWFGRKYIYIGWSRLTMLEVCRLQSGRVAASESRGYHRNVANG